MLDKNFTKEEMDEIKSLGGFDQLMKTLEQRLKEQEKRHQGGWRANMENDGHSQ